MTDYDYMLHGVRDMGMDSKWSRMFIKKFADDEKFFPVNEKERKWAMERGFFPGRIQLYNLTEENYAQYIPDYNYFMLHPINHHFRIWVNDKLTLKYILNTETLSCVMPEYYLYVENDGTYTYLMDCPENIIKDENFIWNLLQEKKILALKPNSGTSGGIGFIKLELRDSSNYIYGGGGIYENNKLINMERFADIQASIRNYIITEYVHQHSELARIWPDSECTLRVIMCKNHRKSIYDIASWSCAVSYARFGTSLNGGASNLSSGGVGVGFDFDTGKYNSSCIRYKKYCLDNIWHLSEHPDTKIGWSSLGLPNWKYVKNMINGICEYISSLSYIGLDIIITEKGMKLCEINTHPAMDYEQVMCGPALSKIDVRDFFVSKGLFNFNGKDFYQLYLRSQR